ncbi:hypothetical protein [Streptomyces sp. NPDC048473]|uniref:hypothetical protein n=1 Tax=unclassified Streptomyces TaxID=2593676 RepID=UPI0037228E33
MTYHGLGPDLADFLEPEELDELVARGQIGPVEYQRRRNLIPNKPISYDAWKQLRFATGTQPGESRRSSSQSPRFVQAQRYLHQLLTGSYLADAAHPPAWQSAADRSRYLAFLPTLTLDQRHALHDHARALLAKLDIAELLTWEPPEDCAADLSLPGRPLSDIDLDALERVVLTERRPPAKPPGNWAPPSPTSASRSSGSPPNPRNGRVGTRR